MGKPNHWCHYMLKLAGKVISSDLNECLFGSNYFRLPDLLGNSKEVEIRSLLPKKMTQNPS